MPDLEQRLREDAARPDPVPDFADALDAAVARPPRRRRHLAGAGVAAAVVLVAVGGAAAFVHGDDTRPAHPHSQHRTATEPPGSSFLAPVGAITEPGSDAPLQLLLVARDRAPGCSEPRLRVRESSTEVRVWMSARDVVLVPAQMIPLNAPGARGTSTPADRAPSRTAPCSGRHYAAVVGALTHPLGDRTLVDGRTGRTLRVLSRPVPAVRSLPRGYHAVGAREDDPMSSAPLDPRPGAFAPLSVAKYYQDAAGSRLLVVAAEATSTVPGARRHGSTSVGAHRALETIAQDAHCVTWHTTADHGWQVCSLPARGRAPVGFAQLVRTARSLHI